MKSLFNFTTILISILLSTTISQAEVYKYAGAAMTCSISATRTAIGARTTQIGEAKATYSFQLFKSQGLTPRLTAYSVGSDTKSKDFLKTGGIPNAAATFNWDIGENITLLPEVLTIPHGSTPPVTIPVSFSVKQRVVPGRLADTTKYRYPNTKPPLYTLDYVAAHIYANWSMDLAHNILLALGDVNTPNFAQDPPISIITNSYASTIDMYAGSFGVYWNQNPDDLHYGNGIPPFPYAEVGYTNGQVATQTVQFHYPAEKYNGLSYHITIECQP